VRPQRPGKLDRFQSYLQERLPAGVWNARVLLRELRERGYGGGYTMLTDWLRPQRQTAHTAAVRRFETPPGRPAQVDLGALGCAGGRRPADEAVGLCAPAELQPGDVRHGGAGPEVGDAAGDARAGLGGVGWGAGGDPVRPDEDGVAGDRRARRDRVESGISGLCAVLGVPAAAVPAGSGADQGQGGVGGEVRAAELLVRVAGPGADGTGGIQPPVAGVGVGRGQSAGARHEAAGGGGALGCGPVQPAAGGRKSSLSLPR